MAAKVKISLSELTLQDVICPICLSILIEPVTMPCSHSLCMPCFNQHVAKTALACPLCRLRISVWVRRSTKSKRLVNSRLWRTIKEKFPAKVEARLEGTEDSDDEDFLISEPRVSAPGEIRQEYEALVKREEKEMASRRDQEEELSNRLILQMQEEEKMKLRQRREQQDNLCKKDEVLAQQVKERETLMLQEKLKELQLLCGSDEEIARRLEKEENQKKQPPKVVATPSRGPMDMYLGQKTPRSHGKLLVPDVTYQSTSKLGSNNLSSPSSDKYSSSPKTILEYRSTPTSSITKYNVYAVEEELSNEGSVPHCNLSSSSNRTESKPGRQLREITSSQSSESESEDFIITNHNNKSRRLNMSGKENVELSENASPCKLGKAKRKSKLFNPLSLHSEATIPRSKMEAEELLTSLIMEDSDETDLDDDDDDYVLPGKGHEKRKNITERHTRSATEQHTESATEQHIESATEQHIESATEQHTESATEQHTESATEQHTESATEQHIESATEQLMESATEQRMESATEQHTESATEQLKESATEQLKESATEQHQDIEKLHHGREVKTSVTKEEEEKVMEIDVNKVDGSSNSLLDYTLLFSNDENDAIEQLKAEQLKVEELLKQEEADRLLAESLQRQMDQEARQVNRSRGSEDEYILRKRKPTASTSRACPCSKRSQPVKRERQATLKETIAKRAKRS